MYKSLFLLVITALLLVGWNSEAKSLYDKESFSSLTSDKRARKVGDTVTIIVLENSQASSSAGTSAESGFDVSAGAENNNGKWDYGVGVAAGGSGDAKTARNGFIKSQITAVVTSVDKNGNLLLKGQQSLTIDGETQKIEITGKARQSDIFSNNTLISSRLFDANIKYAGEGDVSDGKEPSFIFKIFKWLGLA